MGSSASSTLESGSVDHDVLFLEDSEPLMDINIGLHSIKSIKLLQNSDTNTSEVTMNLNYADLTAVSIKNIFTEYVDRKNLSIIMPSNYIFDIRFIDSLYDALPETYNNDKEQNNWKFIEIAFKNNIKSTDIHFNHMKFKQINWNIQYTDKSIQFLWKQYESVSNQYVKDSMVSKTHESNTFDLKIKSLTDSSRDQKLEDLENLDYFLKFNSSKKIIFLAFDAIVKHKHSAFQVMQFCSTISKQKSSISRKWSLYLPIDEFESYELELKCNMVKVLPILSNIFRRNVDSDVPRTILRLMRDMSEYLDFISYDQWMESKFIHELINVIQNPNKRIIPMRDILCMLAKLTPSDSTKKGDPSQFILQDLNVTSVLYMYVTKQILRKDKDTNDKYNIRAELPLAKVQLLFSFRVMLDFIDFENSISDQNVCKWIVHNTYTIKWLLNEWDHALRLAKCDGNFYADAFVRAGIFNKLLSDTKIQRLLISDFDILRYLARSLAFREMTLKRTNKLYRRVCESLYKISNYECNFNILFKYQFEWLINGNMSDTNQNKDVEIKSSVWEKLKWIEENQHIFEDAASFVKKLNANVQNFYLNRLKENAQFISNDVLLEIVSWIW